MGSLPVATPPVFLGGSDQTSVEEVVGGGGEFDLFRSLLFQ